MIIHNNSYFLKSPCIVSNKIQRRGIAKNSKVALIFQVFTRYFCFNFSFEFIH